MSGWGAPVSLLSTHRQQESYWTLELGAVAQRVLLARAHCIRPVNAFCDIQVFVAAQFQVRVALRCNNSARQPLTALLTCCCHSCCAPAAWEGTLDDDEIVAVSAYVFDQATNDKW